MTERWETLFDRGESFAVDLETIRNELARRRESAADDSGPDSGSKPESASASASESESALEPASKSNPEADDA
ncbi:hypothetical protein [Natronosalvus caseinilyticus]|uniref:hypothetical protein n=1 Tax=Natronosalvus caseinilyticus TaxID=2953747 RepID=UPI0028AAB64A|nr:hypothetical protein [Natronosalvus caseinilyticus]